MRTPGACVRTPHASLLCRFPRWDSGRNDIATALTGVDQAIVQAKYTPPAIAPDVLSRDGDCPTVTIPVTDEDGRFVYTASLSFDGLGLGR